MHIYIKFLAPYPVGFPVIYAFTFSNVTGSSKPSSSRANRSNLEAVEDVLGIAIVIPGSRFSNSQAIKLVVNLEDYKKDITDESGE